MKILVADDEVEITETLSKFASTKGYEVVRALDGVQAVELGVNEQPDVILLDINMPGLDGRDVMARLNKEGVTESAVVVFVTGRDLQSDRILGFELGADEYETKPLNFATLFHKIERLLQKKRGETA